MTMDSTSSISSISSFLRAQNFSCYYNFVQSVLSDQRVANFFSLLNYQFKNAELFVESITHRSFAHELPALKLNFNERLEFLGDSLLGTFVAQALYLRFPQAREGELSRMRAHLVNEQALSDLALFMKIDEIILLGKGEEKNQGHTRSSILSSAFEAIMGAIFLDSDEETVRKISLHVLKFYQEEIGQEFFQEVGLDPKSALQEKTMALYQSLPQYHCIETGEGKERAFKVSLNIQGKKVAEEIHISKKKAQKLLAKKALEEKLYEI